MTTRVCRQLALTTPQEWTQAPTRIQCSQVDNLSEFSTQCVPVCLHVSVCNERTWYQSVPQIVCKDLNAPQMIFAKNSILFVSSQGEFLLRSVSRSGSQANFRLVIDSTLKQLIICPWWSDLIIGDLIIDKPDNWLPGKLPLQIRHFHHCSFRIKRFSWIVLILIKMIQFVLEK